MKGAPQWTHLPRGAFSHIDWGARDAADGFDPYLAWAEASRFAGYGERDTPHWLPIIVELAAGCSIHDFVEAGSPEWLRVSDAYLDDALAGLRYCTASIGPPFFLAIAAGGPLHDKVVRFELGLPVGHHAQPRASHGDASAAVRLSGTVLGVIDGGIAFANTAFLRPDGTPRVRWFWRQDAKGVGPIPHSMGYGHELHAATIAHAMRDRTYGGLVDEAAVYSHFHLPDLRRPVNHGTHVASLACGAREVLAGIANLPPGYDAPPSWASANDEASRCDVVAVQLDWSNVEDTSGGSMNVSILDGLIYILSRCEPDARIVVNVSWGTLAGPHNGSSVLEAAMDQLVQLAHRGKGSLDIVLPAGNGYQNRMHANVTLAPGQSTTLHWQVQADDETQDFLELWLLESAKDVVVRLHPPGGAEPSPFLHMGESTMWADADGAPLAAVIFPHRVATGTGSTCALMALAPSFAFGTHEVTAPCGRWRVELANHGSVAATIDAYIERDDMPLGERTGARQSYFEDALYDTSGDPDAFVDVPVAGNSQLASTLIRRSGTFNSIATGARTLSVSGRRIVGCGWSNEALYAPREPDPDASRTERPGVVKVPDRMVWGDETAILLGLRAAGTYSGSVARLVGTSGSTPLATRELLSRKPWRITSARAASSSA